MKITEQVSQDMESSYQDGYLCVLEEMWYKISAKDCYTIEEISNINSINMNIVHDIYTPCY